MKTSTKYRELAAMFLTNDPNVNHVSSLDTITDAGLAHMYGVIRGTPIRYRSIRRKLAIAISDALNRAADRLEQN